MLKKIFLSLSILSIFLFIQIATSLSVKCRMGGPYIKNSTLNSTVNIVGTVTDTGSLVTNISVNLTKAGVVLETKNTTSDSNGRYILTIKRSLDVGDHAINISAEKNGSYAYCNNETDVTLLQTPVCQSRGVQISGVAVYSATGQRVASGIARLSIQGETIANQSSFTDGQFSTILSGCLTAGKRYILQTYIDDNAGKKSWSYMYINW